MPRNSITFHMETEYALYPGDRSVDSCTRWLVKDDGERIAALYQHPSQKILLAEILLHKENDRKFDTTEYRNRDLPFALAQTLRRWEEVRLLTRAPHLVLVPDSGHVDGFQVEIHSGKLHIGSFDRFCDPDSRSGFGPDYALTLRDERHDGVKTTGVLERAKVQEILWLGNQPELWEITDVLSDSKRWIPLVKALMEVTNLGTNIFQPETLERKICA